MLIAIIRLSRGNSRLGSLRPDRPKRALFRIRYDLSSKTDDKSRIARSYHFIRENCCSLTCVISLSYSHVLNVHREIVVEMMSGVFSASLTGRRAMSDLTGRKVLIVEDNGLIGEVIAETIEGAGGRPIGPVLSEREALDIIDYDQQAPDAAVLDISLDGMSFGVADRLRGLGVPFVFATGHSDRVPERFSDVRICQKPYTVHQLLGMLRDAIEGRSGVIQSETRPQQAGQL